MGKNTYQERFRLAASKIIEGHDIKITPGKFNSFSQKDKAKQLLKNAQKSPFPMVHLQTTAHLLCTAWRASQDEIGKPAFCFYVWLVELPALFKRTFYEKKRRLH